MSDPSVLPYIGAGAVLFLLALGFLRMGVMWAWPFALASVACLGVISILPISYRSSVEEAEWVKSLEGRPPNRGLTKSELQRFGPDAEGGDLYRADDAERRLYCVQFRDGRQMAALKAWEEDELRPLESTDLCADA